MKIVFFVLFGVFVLKKLRRDDSRGIRNNNAGNLENNGIDWLGLSPIQTDSRFYQFKEPKYGIRALARTLKIYESNHGINTVQGIINRWAPPYVVVDGVKVFENDTESYQKHVADLLGVAVDQPFEVSANLEKLTEAIIIHENGYNPYSAELIAEGVSLA